MENDKAKFKNNLFCHSRPRLREDKLRRESRRMNVKTYYVYILASERNGILYIGATSDLKKRVYEHRMELVDGFTKKYKIHMLVYYESTSDVLSAIQREKQLKKWNRQWKLNLIERNNPQWKDLYDEL